MREGGREGGVSKSLREEKGNVKMAEETYREKER